MKTTTNTREFPKYETRESRITCFHCQSEVHSKSELTGYIKGKYRQRCDNCLFWTFYDVENDEG